MQKIILGLIAMMTIALSGVVAYSNIYDVPFVFDDVQAITENYSLGEKEWNLEALMHTRSLGYYSFDLTFLKYGKKDPAPYHAGNVIIHILVSLVSFWLVWSLVGLTKYKDKFIQFGEVKITYAFMGAWFVGLLYVLHPLHTQAVTYIVQRLASLTTLFYLLALVLYVRFRIGKNVIINIVWAMGSFLATILAMHTKEIAITLPVAIILMEISFWSHEWKGYWFKRTIIVIPWLLTILIIPAYLLEVRELILPQPIVENQPVHGLKDKVSLRRIENVSAETNEVNRVTYLRTEIKVIMTYVRLVIWPAGLNLDYDVPWIESWFSFAMWSSLLAEVLLVFAAIVLWIKDKKLAGFGILFFFLALMPESSFFPIIDPIFEHRTYLPFIGFALVTVELFLWIVESIHGRRWKWVGNIQLIHLFLIFIIVLLGIAGAATWRRNVVWQDQVSIWKDIVTKSPGKSRPHNNLGLYYIAENNPDGAISEFNRAIELDADYAEAHNNKGMVYIQQGKLDEAEKELNEALRIKPDYAHALNNLGAVLLQYGKLEEAREAFARAVELDENYAGARDNLGMTLVNLGKLSEAEIEFKKVLDVHPDFITSRNNLGVVYFNMGRRSDAYRQFEMVLEYDPSHINAKNNIRLLNQQRGTVSGLKIAN